MTQVTSKIDPSQHNDRSDYYHCFKTQLRDRFGANPGSQAKLKLRVWSIIDPCQRKDEINYYNNLKSQSYVRLRLSVRLNNNKNDYY